MTTLIERIDAQISYLTELKKIHFDELNHLAENNRWLATLVIAEIGGIATYRNLAKEDNLSVSGVLIIILLAITIGLFMFSILSSRAVQKDISSRINSSVIAMKEIIENEEKTPANAKKEVEGIGLKITREISELHKIPLLLEKVGICLFILGSFLTILFLFFSEIKALFGI